MIYILFILYQNELFPNYINIIHESRIFDLVEQFSNSEFITKVGKPHRKFTKIHFFWFTSYRL
jgi:hypothetical protein